MEYSAIDARQQRLYRHSSYSRTLIAVSGLLKNKHTQARKQNQNGIHNVYCFRFDCPQRFVSNTHTVRTSAWSLAGPRRVIIQI